MIVKKIKADREKAKTTSIRDLVDYIRNPRNQNPDEKILYSGGRGFLTGSHEGQREEMVALASEAVRSKNPVSHYILSWKEDEHPTEKQVSDAVDLFLSEMGCDGYQAIYGAHRDTDNVHVHIAINRVHPETNKVLQINHGWDLEAAHKAVAKIEHRQGWRPEKNAMFHALENGELTRSKSPSDKKKVTGRQADIETRTGEKSALRTAIEEAAPIIENATSWEELHAALSAIGVRYEKSGSGAKIYVGDVPVKASDVSRKATLSKLQKKLGSFQPSPSSTTPTKRQDEPMNGVQDDLDWIEYNGKRKGYYENKRFDWQEIQSQIEADRKALSRRQKQERDALFNCSWKGRGKALNLTRSIMAAEQAAEKAELKARRDRLRDSWREQYPPFPTYEEWLKEQDRADLAQNWRNRARAREKEAVWLILVQSDEPPRPADIRDYQAEASGRNVSYRNNAGEIGFIDRGREIEVLGKDDVLAAMQLASQKLGSFSVEGDDDYKELVVKLAAKHGFHVNNPELQDAIKRERQNIRTGRGAVRQHRTSTSQPGGFY